MGLPTIRTLINDADLDLAEEGHENAWIKLAAYQQEVARTQKLQLKRPPSGFKLDDLVMRKVVEKSKKKKFMPDWEGPYRVIKHLGSGNYKIEQMNGTPIVMSWDVNNLRIFHG